MCGIVGLAGRSDAVLRIVESLRLLEYRGYDSAGVAVAREGGIDRRRVAGKLAGLERLLTDTPLSGMTGIGHTRWATHGAPSESNAHPHSAGRVAVVHNGIVENHAALRDELTAEGARFTSDTDTEVIAHLVSREVESGLSLAAAAMKAAESMRGAFAMALISSGEPDCVVAVMRGSPLVAGIGDGETFVASDALALAPLTRRVCYLEDGDCAVLTPGGLEVSNASGPVTRAVKTLESSGIQADKGNHRHFMAKEIFDQPDAVTHTLGHYLDPEDHGIRLPALPFDPASVSRLTIAACGTARLAGLAARPWFEALSRLPVAVDIASEFRYRDAVLTPGDAAVLVSQSGETADTLAALRHCRERGQHVLSVVNVTPSAMARESDVVLPTLAGPEISVASTKAFMCQLVVLAVLAAGLARLRGVMDREAEAAWVADLLSAPRKISECLALDGAIHDIARLIAPARDVIYMGRGANYPLALEGALKLKEISYIHAEGYAAGELKHGPIALVDEDVPVVVIAPMDALFEKTISNLHEVRARGGRTILITDAAGAAAAGSEAETVLVVPDAHGPARLMVLTVPIQLLAYHTAVLKGTDVDQPRNLAKSVTVE